MTSYGAGLDSAFFISNTVRIRRQTQTSSVCTMMHRLTDKFVGPSMNHALIVNLHSSRFSIAQTDGSVE